MTVTVSHNERRSEFPTNHSESNGFGPGVHVMLQDLTHATIAYRDESWTNPSLLNGATGRIIRRDKDLWIVELDISLMVRSASFKPVKQGAFCGWNMPKIVACNEAQQEAESAAAQRYD